MLGIADVVVVDVVLVLVDVVVVLVVLLGMLYTTLVKLSNCLEICHNRFSSVPQPICLDGIAMLLLFIIFYPT
jgi:type III secretory pathway component EscR